MASALADCRGTPALLVAGRAGALAALEPGPAISIWPDRSIPVRRAHGLALE